MVSYTAALVYGRSYNAPKHRNPSRDVTNNLWWRKGGTFAANVADCLPTCATPVRTNLVAQLQAFIAGCACFLE